MNDQLFVAIETEAKRLCLSDDRVDRRIGVALRQIVRRVEANVNQQEQDHQDALRGAMGDHGQG
jgi:hypothetical protein